MKSVPSTIRSVCGHGVPSIWIDRSRALIRLVGLERGPNWCRAPRGGHRGKKEEKDEAGLDQYQP